MIKNINTVNPKMFLLSTLLATSLVAGVQASALQEDVYHSTSSKPSQTVFIDAENAVIKGSSEEILLEVTKGQQVIKDALRSAIEKKLLSNYQPIENLKKQASAIGLEADVIATEFFNTYFSSVIQKSVIEEYLTQKPLVKCQSDYYSSSPKIQVSWGDNDSERVHTTFDTLPLNDWPSQWEGAHYAMPFVTNVYAPMQPTDFIAGMAKRDDLSAKGVTYLKLLHSYVSDKKAEYSLLTFGK